MVVDTVGVSAEQRASCWVGGIGKEVPSKFLDTRYGGGTD